MKYIVTDSLGVVVSLADGYHKNDNEAAAIHDVKYGEYNIAFIHNVYEVDDEAEVVILLNACDVYAKYVYSSESGLTSNVNFTLPPKTIEEQLADSKLEIATLKTDFNNAIMELSMAIAMTGTGV